MIAKPSSNSPLDRKLHSLADPELSERLRSAHPELFAQEQRAAPMERDREEAADSEIGRVIAIVGMLLALVACYALGSIMRAHWNNDVPPLVSLAALAPSHTPHRAAPDHRNLGPAAAQKIIQIEAREIRQQVALARIPAAPAPQPEHHMVALLRPASRPRPATRSGFREEIKVVHARALLASSAADTAPAASSDAAASSDDDTAAGDDVSGRQMARGPVWTENGPGSVIPGSVILGRGGSGGGAGMPGGCRRSGSHR